MAGWVGRIRAAEDRCRDYLEALITAKMYRDELPGTYPKGIEAIYILRMTGGGEPSDIGAQNYETPGSNDGGSPDERFMGAEIKAYANSWAKATEFVEQLWDALPMPEDQTTAAWQCYLTDEPRLERGTIGNDDTQGVVRVFWQITAPLTVQIHKASY